MKGKESEREMYKSLSVMNYIVKTFAHFLAPFAPETAQEIYNSDKDFVLLKSFNNLTYSAQGGNKTVMSDFINIYETLINVRGKVGLSSLKMPLKNLTIITDESNRERLLALEYYMKNYFYGPNINTNDISFVINDTMNLQYSATIPNDKGKKYKKDFPKIKTILENLTSNELKELLIGGNPKILLGDTYVDVSDLIVVKKIGINKENHDNIYTQETDIFTLEIDLTQDETTENKYMNKLLLREIQEMRKRSNVMPWNKILVRLEKLDFIDLDFLIRESGCSFIFDDVSIDLLCESRLTLKNYITKILMYLI